MVVAVVALAVLIGLADDCTDSGSGCAADDGSLETAAKERAEDGSAASADESSFAGADSALIAISVIAVVAVVIVVVAVTAAAHSVIEVGILISILGAGSHREETCGQHERGDEYSFSYLHHLDLDASLACCVRIFSRDAPIFPFA
jgi:hypothetical protein